MESAGKQGSSDASSEENNHRIDDQVKGDTIATTTKRSYECTFCNRGFTNAQALGGHMNIHRKDQAKAKQSTSSAAVSGPMNEAYMNSRYVPPIPTHEPSKYKPILEAQTQRNYHMYIQPTGSSPRLPYRYYECDFLAPARSPSLSMNEELLGANLGLQIGPANVDDNEMKGRGIMKVDDEVDLELRLGHDP